MKAYGSFRHIQHDLIQGSLTCLDLVTHHLQVINQKPELNVFLSVYDDEALTRAKEVDKKIKSGTAGRLAGMVIGLKDVLSYKDHPLQASSKILDGFIAQYNATAVQRLLNEDAIIIGRQNCDEFAMGSSNENSAFGPVLNEADQSRVSGGSSGGSAVAVQAGMCRISIGSDTGGSIRQPASFCGVVGLKPTYSRVSRHGLIAYGSSFDCVGIFGTCIEDVALVLEVIAGSDAYDSTVSKRPVPTYSSQLDTQQKFKIAYLSDMVESNAIQREVKETLKTTLEKLTEQGHQVTPVEFPMMDYILPTYYLLATAEASSNLSRYDGVRYGYRSKEVSNFSKLYKKTRTEAFGKEVKRRILLGTFVLSASYYDAYYSKAQKVRRLVREQTKALFRDYDFLIMPVASTTAFKLNEHKNNPLQMYLADLFSVQANVVGIPGISVPCGSDDAGLPIGLQILADDFEESKLFRFSSILMNLS